MPTYLYRRGDGNDGNHARMVDDLGKDDCPFAALRALVLNDYISGRYHRRFIARNLEIDGESENVLGIVYSGPRGDTAYGAAWLTASLDLLDADDAEYYRDDTGLYRGDIRSVLDRGARAILAKG